MAFWSAFEFRSVQNNLVWLDVSSLFLFFFLVIISAYNLSATTKLGVKYFSLCSHVGGAVLFLNVLVVHRGGKIIVETVSEKKLSNSLITAILCDNNKV